MGKSIQLKNSENENIYPHGYFPVGSIYLSVVNTNPSKWFGGTWEQIAKGRTLVGVDTSQTEFNTVKKTGGSKELQEHYHKIWTRNDGGYDNGNRIVIDGNAMNYKAYWGSTKQTEAAGTGNSGNLQPYFTCYIWLRTA